MTEALAYPSLRSAAIASRLPGTILSIVLLFVPCLASAEIPVPPLKARVTDLTATLSSNEQTQLESRLRDFEQRRGSQIAVLIVPTTQPETIEQYSIRVVEQWKLGRKRVDDGILILVSRDDRRVRLEIGRGLEGAITDALAKRIIAETIVPEFNRSDYVRGLRWGIDRIMAAIEGEGLPQPAQEQAGTGANEWLALWLLASLIAYVVMRQFFAMVPSIWAFGVLAGVGGGFFTNLWFGALEYGAGSMLLAMVIEILNLRSAMPTSGGRYSGNAGVDVGGWSGSAGARTDLASSGIDIGGGGDSFYGGGGEFGGGGASGSW